MNIVKSEHFKAYLLDMIAKREFSERTGIHQSDLVYCLNRYVLRQSCPKPIDENELLLFSLGYATQRWLTGQDEDEKSIEIDGIIVTKDAMYNGVPWELKATFQSSVREIEDNYAWLKQIMAQCYVSGTLTAYLTRFEIMGNWKSIFGKKEEKEFPENRKPTLTAYVLEFTQEELQANWDWLKGRRDLLKQVLSSGELLSKIEAIPSGMDFLCGRCVYQGKECTCLS